MSNNSNHDEQIRKAFDEARMDLLAYGTAFVMFTVDGIRHVPLKNVIIKLPVASDDQ